MKKAAPVKSKWRKKWITEYFVQITEQHEKIRETRILAPPYVVVPIPMDLPLWKMRSSGHSRDIVSRLSRLEWLRTLLYHSTRKQYIVGPQYNHGLLTVERVVKQEPPEHWLKLGRV